MINLTKHTKWLLALLVTTFFFSASPLLSQVVLRKPARPVEVMKKPEKPNATAVWMPGTWLWSDHKHAYEWRPSHWVERKGKKRKWQQGYWTRVRKGYKWVEGKWVK